MIRLLSFVLLISLPARAADVVASFSILGDWAKRVAPAGVEVAVLAGPGIDPHTFEPRPSDLRALKKAKLVLRIGLGFEPWLDRAIKAVDGKARVTTIADELGIAKRRDRRAADPHLWQDPGQAARAIDVLREAFKTEYPAKAGEIDRRADEAKGKFLALRDELKKDFDAIPAERRTIVTSHDAFGYFADAFGLTMLSPQGWSTETEPSAKSVASLIRRIKEGKARALFVEKTASPKIMAQIARETGVKIGGELYGDALSGPRGPAADYESFVRHNASQFLGALKDGT